MENLDVVAAELPQHGSHRGPLPREQVIEGGGSALRAALELAISTLLGTESRTLLAQQDGGAEAPVQGRDTLIALRLGYPGCLSRGKSAANLRTLHTELLDKVLHSLNVPLAVLQPQGASTKVRRKSRHQATPRVPRRADLCQLFHERLRRSSKPCRCRRGCARKGVDRGHELLKLRHLREAVCEQIGGHLLRCWEATAPT
mmetsp:Transcript_25317/g.69631  ORF Transcript_25317/g.69631 Transcript_25317/m.69631 type:complete len:201 (+) Transcript_25317:788-1390(+)